MANDFIIPYSLDDFFETTAVGSLDKAIGNNLYGMNHRQIPGFVPSSKKQYGYTFFVRPQLNLQTDNIRAVRRFMSLLTDAPLSIQRYVRTMLDPRLMTGYNYMNHSVPAIDCPVADNLNAFIPVLSNNLSSISGWPDITLPTYESEPGLYKEVYSQAAGIAKNYESFDVDATFRNTHGTPILYLFYIWLHYAANVFEGNMLPYIDYLTENMIDYNTRIYRVTLDRQRNYVEEIAACGVAYPISLGIGSLFDFTNERPYNDQTKDITLRFRCLGFEVFDDILIKEFNQTVSIFNPDMVDGVRESSMTLLTKADIVTMGFNHRGYPRINPNTRAMEWWIPTDYYTAKTTNFLSSIEASGEENELFTGG